MSRHCQYENQLVLSGAGRFTLCPLISLAIACNEPSSCYSSFSIRRNHLPRIMHIIADYFFSRLLGFFLGSTLAGAGVYYYVLEEYKVSNELLTEDIYVGNPQLR